jgi:hypothetical protein
MNGIYRVKSVSSPSLNYPISNKSFVFLEPELRFGDFSPGFLIVMPAESVKVGERMQMTLQKIDKENNEYHFNENISKSEVSRDKCN